MTDSDMTWPDPEDPGLRIGDAAALLQITPKAIRVYHAHGLLPEPDRDSSGYRRYDAKTLVILGRITRLRKLGLSLREIKPLLSAEDGGAALRSALRDLDEQLNDEINDRRQRLKRLKALEDEQLVDPLEVSPADAAEEQSIAFLRRMIPDLTPEQEAFDRRQQRAFAAFRPPGAIAEAAQEPAGIADDELLAATGGRDAYVDRFHRMFALCDADATDPRIKALAADMGVVTRAVLAKQAARSLPESAPTNPPTPQELERWAAGLQAALDSLPPAIRRVWELVFTDLFTTVTESKAASGGEADVGG